MEPSDEQVEQVARAMWDAAWREARAEMPRLARLVARGSAWDAAAEDARRKYRGYARTAIAAWEEVRPAGVSS